MYTFSENFITKYLRKHEDDLFRISSGPCSRKNDHVVVRLRLQAYTVMLSTLAQKISE